MPKYSSVRVQSVEPATDPQVPDAGAEGLAEAQPARNRQSAMCGVEAFSREVSGMVAIAVAAGHESPQCTANHQHPTALARNRDGSLLRLDENNEKPRPFRTCARFGHHSPRICEISSTRAPKGGNRLARFPG